MDERSRIIYKNLGARVQMLRKLKGYTQEEFAEVIDRSASFLSQLESNNAKDVKGMSMETLFRISEALGSTPSKLLEGAEEWGKESEGEGEGGRSI